MNRELTPSFAPLVALSFACAAIAQPSCEPGWAEPFANAPGINSEVRTLAMFDDGSGPKLYAGGYFSEASGQTARGLARWEGDHWAEVGGGVSPVGGGQGVFSLTVLDTGSGPRLYVGGDFQTAGGIAAPGVAIWDGQSWSPMGAGLNNQVRALCIFDDGAGPAIYATGWFTASGQTTIRGLARWTGSAWQEVGGGLLPDPSNVTQGLTLGVFDLGQGPRLLVGGKFSQPSTTPGEHWNNIAAWDGTSWSGLGIGVYGNNGPVMKMIMFDHGAGPQLTIAGGFSIPPNWGHRARVARWTGAEWVQVGSDLGNQETDFANSLAVLPGTAGPVLHVGGWFGKAGGVSPTNFVAQWVNGDWADMGGGMPHYVRSMIAAEEGGKPVIYAGGWFTYAGGSVASRVAKWDGVRWHGFEHGRGLTFTGSPGFGYAACLFDDGAGERLFVGGTFTGAGDVVSSGIASWNGQEWHRVGEGGLTWQGFTRWAADLAIFDDGSGLALYATGEFDRAGNTPCLSVARWNGVEWTAPGGSGISLGSPVGRGNALRVHDDGAGPALYVGGSFAQAGSFPAGCVARWNGTLWSGLGNGPGLLPLWASVDALEVFDEGSGPRLFVGGSFTSIGGVPAAAIARWDGSGWSDVGGGFPPATPTCVASVAALAVVNHGGAPRLYAGGRSGEPGEPSALLLARWDGQSWEPLSTTTGIAPLSGSVSHVWSFDDGDGPALYVGGALTLSGTTSPVGMLRRRAGVWELPGGGVTHTTSALSYIIGVLGTAVRREGDHDVLFLAGRFDRAGGQESAGVAEWRACRVCHADCNRDGALTPADFGCFQSRFLGADPYADCNTDGALTVQDFGCFQTKFVTGCP